MKIFLLPKTALHLLLCLAAPMLVLAQAKPAPDVLVLVTGEKLIGHMKSATSATVTFQSDLIGEATVPWAKVQELHTEGKFAAIPASVKVRSAADASKVPQGTIALSGKNLEVKPDAGDAKTVALSDVSTVIPKPAFDSDVKPQGLLEGWKGALGFGMAVTRATTNTRTINAYVSLVRRDPSAAWEPGHTRTMVDFTTFSGKTDSFGVVTADFLVFQSSLTREFLLTPRQFVFAGGSWDHNSNQGLDLSQAYGGGYGYTVHRSDTSEFTVRAGLGYVHQAFSDPTLNKNLLGSRLNQTYSKTFKRGITFTETAGFRPAWNDSKAYMTGYTASLSVPMYKHFNVSVNSFDSYVNDPPPYFKRNTLQVSFGVNYFLH